jgi:hypothetical protein
MQRFSNLKRRDVASGCAYPMPTDKRLEEGQQWTSRAKEFGLRLMAIGPLVIWEKCCSPPLTCTISDYSSKRSATKERGLSDTILMNLIVFLVHFFEGGTCFRLGHRLIKSHPNAD